MSNMVCQINPEKSLFQGLDKADSVVCPNCRSSLDNCNPRISCLANPPPPPCLNCQRCLMATTPCLASGMVPHFPLPYVCRHWLSVSSTGRNSLQPSCTHSCEQPALHENRTIGRPVSQIDITSPNPFVLSGGAVQRLDIDTTFKNEINMCNTRSNSPETNVVPEIIFTFNGVPIAKIQQSWTSEDDYRVLSKTKEDLELCGWFYGRLTWQEAAALLANSNEGSFLVRNSSSSRCPYALSIQTPQGPTSIRVEYERGHFWLDCERKGVTPQFDDIMQLISYYQEIGNSTEKKTVPAKIQEVTTGKTIWVDHKGKVYSPISITKPLLQKPSPLKHLCRLSLNANGSHQQLNSNLIPTSLIRYLSQYPYGL